MRDSCILLLYNDVLTDTNELVLPNYILRIDAHPQVVKENMRDILKKTQQELAQTVVFLEDCDTTMTDIHNLYEDFAYEHNCQVRWKINDFHFPKKQLQEYIVAFYTDPVFMNVNKSIDIDNEPPVSLMVHDHKPSAQEMKIIINQLNDEYGLKIKFYTARPATEDNINYFAEKANKLTEDINRCYRCLHEYQPDENECKSCKFAYARVYKTHIDSILGIDSR